MKTLTLILAVAIATLMTNLAQAEEGDSTRVITKIVKITDDGKTVVDTTIVYTSDNDDQFFTHYLNGSKMHMMKHPKMTGSKGHVMMWTNDEDQEYEVTIESDGDSSNVVVMHPPGKMMKKFRFDNDPMQRHMMTFNDEDFAALPDLRVFKQHKKNMIDLNDPDIISFKREQTKNGNEKITIIRTNPEEKE